MGAGWRVATRTMAGRKRSIFMTFLNRRVDAVCLDRQHWQRSVEHGWVELVARASDRSNCELAQQTSNAILFALYIYMLIDA